MRKKSLEKICDIYVVFDGACEPVNPNGNMGIGYAIFHPDKTLIHEHAECIMFGEKGFSQTSNNVAEYLAATKAIDYLLENKYTDKTILFMGDSKLVVEQMNGVWQIKQGIYVPYALDCMDARKGLYHSKFRWIPREQNVYADNLSKREMKKRGVEFRLQKG